MGQNIYREQDFPFKSVAENNNGNFILMDAVCQATWVPWPWTQLCQGACQRAKGRMLPVSRHTSQSSPTQQMPQPLQPMPHSQQEQLGKSNHRYCACLVLSLAKQQCGKRGLTCNKYQERRHLVHTALSLVLIVFPKEMKNLSVIFFLF